MFATRLNRLQRILPQHKLNSVLITHPPNLRYLLGFSGSAGALLAYAEGQSIFFTDGRYKEQARLQVHTAKVRITRNAPLVAAAEWMRSHDARQHRNLSIGIEAAHLSVADRDRLARVMPHNCRIKSAPPLVEQQRMIKEEGEVDAIRAAVLSGAALFDVVVKSIRAGVKENAVAAELEYAARKAGCESMAFETIIASGPRSALPHGRASDKSIPRRGFVVCDFGVILAGYCSDMTRTVYVGRPDKEARSFYNIVREAQLAAIEVVRPGVPVGEVDRKARSVLKKAGLARYFTHSTGHGVGLEIHEAPRIAAGQAEILHPGMVITIEPGAYIPRRWGVRIEDTVAVTESGCEVLTPTSKDLICI